MKLRLWSWMNESKNDKVGDRQLSHAKALHDAGLLSAEGLKKVQNARREYHSAFCLTTPRHSA